MALGCLAVGRKIGGMRFGKFQNVQLYVWPHLESYITTGHSECEHTHTHTHILTLCVCIDLRLYFPSSFRFSFRTFRSYLPLR